MANSACWQCLCTLRLKPTPLTRLIPPPQSAAFSTSAILLKNPGAKAKSITGLPPKKGTTSLRIRKTKREVAKGAAPGERKAIRKRIVLSNTNAFEVPDLKNLNVDNFMDKSVIGTMLGFPGSLVDSLRANESFKATQGWNFFKRPASLIRQETRILTRHMQELDDGGNAKTLRSMVIGERGTGKSVYLLQAHAMAFLKGWVVIHLPEAQDVVIGHTTYAPLPQTDPVKYVQKDFTANLLRKIAQANRSVLSNLTPSEEHTLPFRVPNDTSLDRLAEMGANEPEHSWATFQALWKELTTPNKSQPRPPILMTLDGIAHVCRPSEYLAPNMHYIHAHDLAIVDHFMSYLSGNQSLPQGGIVLAADSNSNRASAPALDLVIRQNEGADLESLPTLPLYDPNNPYAKYDTQSIQALRNVPVIRLKGFSKPEARAVLEYYAKSGMLAQTITDTLVGEKVALAGGGIIGELERDTMRQPHEMINSIRTSYR